MSQDVTRQCSRCGNPTAGALDDMCPLCREEISRHIRHLQGQASQQQVGGDHYKTFRIQPAEFSQKNGLGFLEGCVVKRVCRHDQPTGKGREDIEKAIHELQLILEWEYGEAREQSND